MKVAVFSAKPYDRQFLDAANSAGRHELEYFDAGLTSGTICLAEGSSVVCLFSSDRADRAVIERLAAMGVRLIALRSAGFDNVDLQAAQAHGIEVCRVPAYSPNAVAEHAFGLILSLARHITQAHDRIREGNFSLSGLLGFTLAGKTIGIVGVGNIGAVVAQIARGFGCSVLGSDPLPRTDCRAAGVHYCSLGELLARSDIVTLHCPLADSTRHLIGSGALARMKRGAMLINTSRGAVLDTRAAIHALESGQLGCLGIDVYENETGLFFADHSGEPIRDEVFLRLRSFPNVLITGHQGFFTAEALEAIAETTIANIDAFERDGVPIHPLAAMDRPATGKFIPERISQ